MNDSDFNTDDPAYLTTLADALEGAEEAVISTTDIKACVKSIRLRAALLATTRSL